MQTKLKCTKTFDTQHVLWDKYTHTLPDLPFPTYMHNCIYIYDMNLASSTCVLQNVFASAGMRLEPQLDPPHQSRETFCR